MFKALDLITAQNKLGMGAHAYNPSTREVDAGGPETQGYPQLRKDFKVKDSEPKKIFFFN